MSPKSLYEELASLQYDLEQGNVKHATWHVNDLMRRLRKNLPANRGKDKDAI